MKKFLLLFFVILLSVSPVSAEREFIDSTGRTVMLPDEVRKVAVSGPMTQIILFALCPDRLVGLSERWDASGCIDPKYLDLPVLGQLYGGKGDLDPEMLLASGAEAVIDIGEPKDSIREDMDRLEELTGIPFVHIDASTAFMGDAYRKAGELLGMQAEAETLAAYCDEEFAYFTDLAGRVDKPTALYFTGVGTNVTAKGSYHSEIIDLLTENAALVDAPSAKGIGNEADLEQIMNWDPEVIFFAPGDLYETLPADETWQTLQAIRNGRYYEVPYGPYNWLGFPPSVQRYLGMFWLADTLYPEAVDYDLHTEIARYFELFYHCSLQ